MTREEMKSHMATVGLSKDYKVTWDTDSDERGVVLFKVGKPAKIVDGNLEGTEIVLTGNTLTVWTSHGKKAIAYAKLHGLTCRKYADGAEFKAPAILGDDFLTHFGAKVKRTMSQERKNALAATLCKARQQSKTLSGS